MGPGNGLVNMSLFFLTVIALIDRNTSAHPLMTRTSTSTAISSGIMG